MTVGAFEPGEPAQPVDQRRSADGLARVLERGRAKGWLSQDDLDELIRHADLTVDYIDALRASVEAEGIRWVEEHDVENEVDLESLIEVVAAAVVEEDEAADEEAPVEPAVVAPDEVPAIVKVPRLRRPRREVAEDDANGGPYADLVRMYLGEIGKVPLLNAGEEVELAQRIEKGAQAACRLAELELLHGEEGVPFQLRRVEERAVVDGLKA